MAFAFRQPLIERGRRHRGLFTLLLVLVSVIMVVESRTIIVGNQMGWTNYDIKSFQVPDYIQWASSQHVRVGDQLGKTLYFSLNIIYLYVISYSFLLNPFT